VYLRVDRAFDLRQPTGQALFDAARRFDLLTSRVLMQRMPDALRGLHELALRLEKNREPTAAESLAGALRVRIEPPIWTIGSKHPPEIEIGLAFEPPPESIAAETPIVVVLDGPGLGRSINVTLPAGMEPGQFESRTLEAPERDLIPGAYFVTVQWPGGVRTETGRFFVVEKPMDEWRLANEARLVAALAEHAGIEREIEICRARNALLVDQPGDNSIALLMMEPLRLRDDVLSEVATLERGENPYAGRRGAYWRTLRGRGSPVPMWVLAPDREGPLPLVIALHGAGANEGIFVFAYGNGELGLLAEQHGFLLACPSTLLFGTDPTNVERLIDDLSRDYPVDRQRVYVLGHSLGGIATAGLVASTGRHITAACGIAGFRSITPGPESPPTLVIAAENDPIVPASMVQAAARRSQDAGLDVEYRSVPDYGHTFIVGHVLSDVVEWLMRHRRDVPQPR